MKKLLFSSLFALALLSSCANSSEKPKTDSLKDTIKTPAAVVPAAGTPVAEVKYQCPMKCEGEKTYAAPGKCPMCQMDMKEVK